MTCKHGETAIVCPQCDMETIAANKPDIEVMLQECMENESKLNNWERSFIDNLYHKLEEDQYLTLNERNKLKVVWAKAVDHGD